jgi:hypothetical protein
VKIPFKGYFPYILPPMIPKTGKINRFYPVIQAIIWDKGRLKPLPHMGS